MEPATRTIQTVFVCAALVSGCGGGGGDDEPEVLTLDDVSTRIAERFPEATRDVAASVGYSPETPVLCSFFGDLQADGLAKNTCLIVSEEYAGDIGTPTVSSSEPRVHLLDAITPGTATDIDLLLDAVAGFSAFKPLIVSTLGGIDFGIHPLSEAYTAQGEVCVEPGLAGAEAQLLATATYVDSSGTRYPAVALDNDGTGCFSLPDVQGYPVDFYEVENLSVQGPGGDTFYAGLLGSFQVTAANGLPSGTLTRTGSYQEIDGAIRDINGAVTYECVMEDPEEGLLEATLERRFDGGEWLAEPAFSVDILEAGGWTLEARCAATDSYGAVGYSDADRVDIHQNTGPVITNPEDFAYLAEYLVAWVGCTEFFVTLECSVDPESDAVISSQTFEGWYTFDTAGELTMVLSCLDEYGTGEVAVQTIIVHEEEVFTFPEPPMDFICLY